MEGGEPTEGRLRSPPYLRLLLVCCVLQPLILFVALGRGNFFAKTEHRLADYCKASVTLIKLQNRRRPPPTLHPLRKTAALLNGPHYLKLNIPGHVVLCPFSMDAWGLYKRRPWLLLGRVYLFRLELTSRG